MVTSIKDVTNFVGSLNEIAVIDQALNVKEMLELGCECFEIKYGNKHSILTNYYSPFDNGEWLRPYVRPTDQEVWLDINGNQHATRTLDNVKKSLVGLPNDVMNQVLGNFNKLQESKCELKDYHIYFKCGIPLFSDFSLNLTELQNVDNDSSWYSDCSAIAFGNSFCTEPIIGFSKHNKKDVELRGKSYKTTYKTKRLVNTLESTIKEYYPHTLQAFTDPKDINDLRMYPINTLYNTEKIYIIKVYKDEFGVIDKIRVYGLLRRNSELVSKTTKKIHENIDFQPTFKKLHEMLQRQDQLLMKVMRDAESKMKPLTTLMAKWTDYKSKYANVVLPLPNAQLNFPFEND